MVDEHAIIGGGGIDVDGDNGTGNENVWPKEIRVNSRMVCRIIFGVFDGRLMSYSLLVNMYLFRTEIRRTVLCIHHVTLKTGIILLLSHHYGAAS